MRAEKKPFWVLLGPALLLAVVVLLVSKWAPLLGSPVWLFGLAIATLIACWICILAFQEITSLEKEQQLKVLRAEKEVNDLRSVLDETHLLYRGKVSKLEASISECENDLSQLQTEQEGLLNESNYHQNRARSFQVSLEEALQELRELAFIHHSEKERQQSIPNDLIQLHQQLREQFEEKSLILDQTRRRLFETEGFLFGLKREKSLEQLDLNVEQQSLFKCIEQLIEENMVLENEVSALEELITASQKPKSSRKAREKLQEMLEFQFDAPVT